MNLTIPGMPPANTVGLNEVVASLMNPMEVYPGQHQVSLYVLLLLARFDELRETSDYYVSQAALKLASRNDLSGHSSTLRHVGKSATSGCELLRGNLQLKNFTITLPANGDLLMATRAWPPEYLDELRSKPAPLFERQALLGSFLVTSAYTRPELLQKKTAQLAFEMDIMQAGAKFWGKQAGAVLPGPVKASFDEVWGADRALLLRYALQLDHEVRSPAADGDDELPPDEADDGSGYDSRELFATLLDQPVDGLFLTSVRKRLIGYRKLVTRMVELEQMAATVHRKWGGLLDRSDLWVGRAIEAGPDIPYRKFTPAQMIIAGTAIKRAAETRK